MYRLRGKRSDGGPPPREITGWNDDDPSRGKREIRRNFALERSEFDAVVVN